MRFRHSRWCSDPRSSLQDGYLLILTIETGSRNSLQAGFPVIDRPDCGFRPWLLLQTLKILSNQVSNQQSSQKTAIYDCFIRNPVQNPAQITPQTRLFRLDGENAPWQLFGTIGIDRFRHFRANHTIPQAKIASATDMTDRKAETSPKSSLYDEVVLSLFTPFVIFRTICQP